MYEDLNRFYPNWTEIPPPEISLPFIRDGYVDFATAPAQPPQGAKIPLAELDVPQGQVAVIRSMELRAAALVDGVLNPLALEAGIDKIRWFIEMEDTAARVLQGSRRVDGTTTTKADALGFEGFRGFSVGLGTMTRIIAQPGSKIRLVMYHTNPASGPVIPTGSKITGAFSGFLIQIHLAAKMAQMGLSYPNFTSPKQNAPVDPEVLGYTPQDDPIFSQPSHEGIPTTGNRPKTSILPRGVKIKRHPGGK